MRIISGGKKLTMRKALTQSSLIIILTIWAALGAYLMGRQDIVTAICTVGIIAWFLFLLVKWVKSGY